MSSLLGCTGDSADYLPNLEEISAVMDESDAIFGAQCPCPIIDLDHSDMAYEWMFGAKDSYRAPFSLVSRQLTPLQKALSSDFAAEYPANVNSLDLALTLGEDGHSRSYYESLLEVINGAKGRRLGKKKSRCKYFDQRTRS